MRRDLMGVLATLAILSAPFFVASARAQEFRLQVGPPIAGGPQPTKDLILVVRPGGCADPARAQISATAEGIVDGARRSLPLTLSSLPTPGVHALPKEWTKTTSGVWVVNLIATCAGKTAGALVPIERNATFKRGAIKQLAHHATRDEIDASLKALTTGGQK